MIRIDKYKHKERGTDPKKEYYIDQDGTRLFLTKVELEKIACDLNLLGIANVSGIISVEDTVNAFLDWMKSDDCWINDKDGNRIPDAEIDGKNFMKYAEKYYR